MIRLSPALVALIAAILDRRATLPEPVVSLAEIVADEIRRSGCDPSEQVRFRWGRCSACGAPEAVRFGGRPFCALCAPPSLSAPSPESHGKRRTGGAT